MNVSQKQLDNYILAFDTIIQINRIVGLKNNKICTLQPNNIITSKVNINNKYFLIVICENFDKSIVYQTSNGKIYYRLNSSIYFNKGESFYTQTECNAKVSQKIATINNEYIESINIVKKEYDDLENAYNSIKKEYDDLLYEKNKPKVSIWEMCFPKYHNI